MTIVRINQGQLGLAFSNSQPRLLLPGLHVYNSPSFQYQKTVDITETFISLGPVSIFTVGALERSLSLLRYHLPHSCHSA